VDVFSEMIFCHGYVHGDPHPGNILVHKHPSRSGKNNFDLGGYFFPFNTSMVQWFVILSTNPSFTHVVRHLSCTYYNVWRGN
jgi:hypothetical protein